jgi:hypothetical protein
MINTRRVLKTKISDVLLQWFCPLDAPLIGLLSVGAKSEE